jgi:dTDP-4-amino-4,6-dideoxygalactose transaminase
MNRAIAEAYRSAARTHGLAARLFVAPDVASNYALLDAGSPSTANAVIAALRAKNIESRRWYGCGLHHEPYWHEAQRDPLPATDRIAPSVVGLPIYCDIAATDIERTIATAAGVLAGSQSAPV